MQLKRSAIILCAALVLLVATSVAEATPATAEPQGRLARKLLDTPYYWNGRGRRDSITQQQIANSNAIVNTQYAIRSAVESGANPYVTRAAANYGNDQAWWAANYRNYGRGNWWYYG